MDDTFEVEVSRHLQPVLVKVLRRHGLTQEAKEFDDAVERYGARTITLQIGDWSVKLLQDIIPLLADERKARSYCRALLKIKLKPTSGTIKKLTLLPRAMKQYLVSEAIDGWVYEEVIDGVHIAWVVDSIDYTPEDRHYNRKEHVTMNLKANRTKFPGEDRESHDDGIEEKYVHFHRDDIAGRRNAAKVLLHAGLLKETKELKTQYEHELDLFQKYRPQEGCQFLCSGSALEAENNYWWSRSESRYTLMHPTKMVNDEGILGRKITHQCSNYSWYEVGVKDSPKDNRFARIPVQPFVLFYDLTRYTHVWIHILNCKPYVYDKTLREKLVLPKTHRDLIDVLTTDMDVFVEDIIEGKSGGTAVLCFGAAGLGKTLTAEVYSEVVGRPLYRVHAGQLGTTIETVETTLEATLRRAERWGAVLLLDEADVYIRRRDNDMDHNAVVAAFLRTLEYFHGLLFLTTNRGDDVDDAIASRMVATFRYELPDKEQSTQIWTILSKQFGIVLSEKMITQLVHHFDKASGRDIKQLLKLTMKYCKVKEVKMDMKAFTTCAMFRGLA